MEKTGLGTIMDEENSDANSDFSDYAPQDKKADTKKEATIETQATAGTVKEQPQEKVEEKEKK